MRLLPAIERRPDRDNATTADRDFHRIARQLTSRDPVERFAGAAALGSLLLTGQLPARRNEK